MKRVRITKNVYNFLKDDGTYLLDEHVYDCWLFNEGLGILKYYDNTENYVNSEGELLLKTNVENCGYFVNGFAEVKINNILYYIDKECNFYTYELSFKDMYQLYPQKRQELIDIVYKYTYFDIEEYFI